MAHPKNTRDRLRTKYITDRLSLPAAAQIVGITDRTAQRWKREARATGDDWDRLKDAHLVAGGSLDDISRGMLAGFVEQYQNTLNLLKTPDEGLSAPDRVKLLASLADAFTKTIAANARVMPQTSQLATALEVLQLLGEMIRARYPKELGIFVNILQEAGKEIEQRFS